MWKLGPVLKIQICGFYSIQGDTNSTKTNKDSQTNEIDKQSKVCSNGTPLKIILGWFIEVMVLDGHKKRLNLQHLV